MSGEKTEKTEIKVIEAGASDSASLDRDICEERMKSLLFNLIFRRVEIFFQHGHRTMYANDLKKRMEKGERLFLLDIRLSEDYAAGHIPGSVNAEFIDIMETRNMAMLPKDGTPIIIICYTGHTASQLNSILNVLGYNAWTLKFGMLSWTPQTRTGIWSSKDSQEVCGGGFYITESNPGCGSNGNAYSMSNTEQD